jgi:hypothetical protein
MEKILKEIEHFSKEHRKVMIAVGVIIVIALII